MKKLNAEQLRKSKPTEEDVDQITRNPIYLVLDRIIDTYNIGSFFRLADAIAVKKVFLCGEMEYPPNSRVHKAAVGTENWVPWERRDTTFECVQELKAKGIQTIAIEQAEGSLSYKNLEPEFPVAIIAGNESYGMRKEVLDKADIIVEIPMYGVNISFNTWGTTAVIAYKILENLKS